MRKYLIAIVLVGFLVGVIIGCAVENKAPEVSAAVEGAKFNVVVGQNENLKPVFMRYDTQTGETWTWVPGGTVYWVPLKEAP